MWTYYNLKNVPHGEARGQRCSKEYYEEDAKACLDRRAAKRFRNRVVSPHRLSVGHYEIIRPLRELLGLHPAAHLFAIHTTNPRNLDWGAG